MVIFIHAFLTVVIQSLTQRFIPNMKKSSSQRLGFMLSFMFGVMFWLFQRLALDMNTTLVRLGTVFMGAFLGALLITALDEGLSENSFPPPKDTEEHVHKNHLKIAPPIPEPFARRFLDGMFALLGLVITSPIWIVVGFLLWFEDPGPLFFIKNSCGRGGKNFRQFKFRSMVHKAEAETGPIPALKKDKRMLIVGRFLRGSYLDELPQLINILRGEMSFVGPRPLRTVDIYKFMQDLPEFSQRHRVLPGIAGLAQVVKGYYYTSPSERLRLDNIYINYRNLFLDIKIIILAVFVTLRRGKEIKAKSLVGKYLKSSEEKESSAVSVN